MDSLVPSLHTLEGDYVAYTITLSAITLWLLLHRLLLNRGFVFRRQGLSTDTRAAFAIGVSCTLWTGAVFRRVLVSTTHGPGSDGDGTESGTGPGSWGNYATAIHTLSEMAIAPLLVQTLFIFWLSSWLDSMLLSRAANSNSNRPSRLVTLSHVHDIYSWESGLHPTFYRIFLLTITLVVSVPASCAIATGQAATGILNLAGLAVFILDGVPKHTYFSPSVAHRYCEDTLRIVLPTTHHEGTTYVLPSRNRGMDATWSSKIAAEHAEADGEIMVLFSKMRAQEWEPSEVLKRLRSTMAAYRERVASLSVGQAERLARWIYADGGDMRTRAIECARAPGVHLIGRDLMFALCIAEYLVFISQGRLSRGIREQIGKLRLMRRSGAGDGEGQEDRAGTIGYLPGIEGYKEAVEHVYSIFDIPVERAAVEFTVQPPAHSFALKKAPAGIEEYVGDLWDLATHHSESTFSALYFFTTVWFMEMGNVNGFHIFPLRVSSRDGDVQSRMVIWRQAWFAACVGQLLSVSWIGFGGFVSGYFP
ncbi:hypothetical protein MKZ38_002074 [Zalerion maritima]|uniref:Uncharacterized protein n=1 Tax=Zalerion maritima TaxID=339359 RepID=A0AAD5RZF6_9PEZI|nr:hypothetical protein MKZ38_002074 [Zalerion maritima]